MYYALTALSAFVAGGGIALYFAYQAWRSSSKAGDAREAAATAEGGEALLTEKLANQTAQTLAAIADRDAIQKKLSSVEALCAQVTLDAGPAGPGSRAEFVQALSRELAAHHGDDPRPSEVSGSSTSHPTGDALLNPFVPGSDKP